MKYVPYYLFTSALMEFLDIYLSAIVQFDKSDIELKVLPYLVNFDVDFGCHTSITKDLILVL